MAHEEAIDIVNTLHMQMAELARAIVNALKDGKISAFEGISLGTKGITFATYVLTLLQGTDAATRADLLYVLEHAVVSVKE